MLQMNMDRVIHSEARNEDIEIFNILASLIDNPNATDDYGKSPSSVAKNE